MRSNRALRRHPAMFPQSILRTASIRFAAPARWRTRSLQFADYFNLTIERHQLTFGGEYIERVLDFQVSTQQNPGFDFNGQFTNDPVPIFCLAGPRNSFKGTLQKLTSWPTIWASVRTTGFS